ncbi:MAG: polysaccharide deacetylase family protein [Actinobacteria bacterium]|nr:polysaccharide deacetylase family protein [Actinomycetota bacterium]
MTHGDAGWEAFPTYLDALVAVVLPMLEAIGLRITFFVVGQDAALEKNHAAIAALATAGHEIGNHSFRHQPWLHLYTLDEIHTELARTEEALQAVTGQRPVGFRGPGYSLSPDVLRALMDRGYEYDASTLPTVIGPLARRYYFRSARLSPQQRSERAHLYGHARDGLQPLKPYQWVAGPQSLVEIPVTTMPLTRVPIHISYVLYLAGPSPAAAYRYFSAALRMCALRGVQPSILLHPLDFLGVDDVDSLQFFPGMHLTGARKRETVERCLRTFAERFEVAPLREHARALKASGSLPGKSPWKVRSPSASAVPERIPG